MNRRLLWQITTPSAVIGVVLFAACLVIAWRINQLDSNLARILSQNVRSLEAAQDLEIRVRQLRTHCFLVVDRPRDKSLRKPIEEDNRRFEEALRLAESSAGSPEERATIKDIQAGYAAYREDLDKLLKQAEASEQRIDLAEFSRTHPIRHVTDPCHKLFNLNKQAMEDTAGESERVSRQALLLTLLLGLGGPASGLLVGYSVARGLSRSIYRLSVRVNDVAQRLDEKVASMSIAVDGDIENLDKQVQHVVGQVEEVAERLQRHQREMLRAEQLAAVGQLAASVAHEVRNPLTSVKMLVDAALRPNNGMPLTTEDLQVIHGEVARLEQTVQGFLDFARLPSPQRHPCDLREVVSQGADLVRARARQQGVAIEIRDPESSVSAFADAAQLRTVLVNLFINALDMMPKGGRLEVHLGKRGDAVEVSVVDTGPGIAAEMTSRLFTPFASTKPTGTGLGLSISRRILEEHGGTLTGHNRPKGGACFTLSLPAGAR